MGNETPVSGVRVLSKDMIAGESESERALWVLPAAALEEEQVGIQQQAWAAVVALAVCTM